MKRSQSPKTATEPAAAVPAVDRQLHRAVSAAGKVLQATKHIEPESWSCYRIHERIDSALVQLAEALTCFQAGELAEGAAYRSCAESLADRALKQAHSGWSPHTRGRNYRGHMTNLSGLVYEVSGMLAEDRTPGGLAEARSALLEACEEAQRTQQYHR